MSTCSSICASDGHAQNHSLPPPLLLLVHRARRIRDQCIIKANTGVCVCVHAQIQTHTHTHKLNVTHLICTVLSVSPHFKFFKKWLCLFSKRSKALFLLITTLHLPKQFSKGSHLTAHRKKEKQKSLHYSEVESWWFRHYFTEAIERESKRPEV